MKDVILNYVSAIDINFNRDKKLKPTKWEVRRTYCTTTLKSVTINVEHDRLYSFFTDLTVWFDNNTKQKFILFVANKDVTKESNSDIDIDNDLYIQYSCCDFITRIDSIYFNYKNILPEVKQRIKELMCEYDEKVLTK